MSFMRKTGRTLLAATALAATMGSANAALLDGKTVSFQYFYPDLGSSYSSTSNGNYVVGAGVEIPNGICCGFEGQLDLSGTKIRADFFGNSSYSSSTFNGFRISDVLGQIDAFTSVSIDAVTNMVGFDASRITFDENNIWVNWQGLSFAEGIVVSLDIGGSGNVPEPGVLALVGLGLAGLAGARRRKAK